MRTYRAELAPFRMKPLPQKFVDKALAHARLINLPNWSRRQAFETTCPYCGCEDRLSGTIRIGAKEQISKIPMTRTGYEVPEAGDREREILVIHCLECKAAIDPLAYLSPAVFYAEKEDVQIFPDES